MEKHIKMAAKLYRCRDTAKRFFKEEFKEKILPYQKVISGIAKQNNIGELDAMLKLCEDDVINTNGWALVLIMAATVEMIEPSN